MILTCPSCTISYELPIELPPEGRKVRCAKCAHVWLASPSDEQAADLPQQEEFPQPQAETPEAPPSDPAMEEAAAGFAPEPQMVEALPPDMSVDDMDVDFRDSGDMSSPDENADDAAFEALAAELSEPQADAEDAGAEGQDAIDALLEEASSALNVQGQDGVDALFDEAASEAVAEEPAGQGDIDDIMASFEAGAAEDVFDNAAEPAAEAPSDPLPEMAEDAAFDPQPFAEPPVAEAPAMEAAAPAPAAAAAAAAAAAPAPAKAKSKQQATMLAAGWGALAASIIGFAAVVYFNGEGVVRSIPGAAKIYETAGSHVNIRGLEFRGVSYSWEAEAGQPVLHVKGSVVNVTDKTLSVPTVVFALRDDQGAELFHWAKNVHQEPLSAGQSAGFAARIPSPPKSVRSLQVRFAKAK